MIAQVLLCLVIAVVDGDTIKANCDGRDVRVRLEEIDAPEKSQHFGMASKMELQKICLSTQAQLTTHGIDKYGRTLAHVKCDSIDAQEHQVKSGMAWVYRKYSPKSHLIPVEDAAKAEHIGLWSEASPTPPWEFRNKK